jgi:hypothetical protein
LWRLALVAPATRTIHVASTEIDWIRGDKVRPELEKGTGTAR